MAPEPLELRPTVDRRWLEQAAAADPITHAFALWDLDRFPGQVRFVSAYRGDRMLGYLLVWGSPRGLTVVQWLAPPLPELAAALPPRPVRVFGSADVAPLVRAARGPCTEYTLLLESAPLGAVPPPTPRDGGVRRLTRDDVRALGAVAQDRTDDVAPTYLGVDPGADVIFGGFEGSQLVSVARASIRRPSVWIVGGVYTVPAARGRGWGKAVTRAVMAEAAAAGAFTALYVREDRPAARAVYDRLGFHPVRPRVHCDCGIPSE